MQKHSSLVENAPTAHIFYHLTIDINSQHPHLLGFDSNLVPNSSIYYFSRILERILNIQNVLRDSHVIQHFILGIPRIIGKFIRLVLFFLQDTAGSTANTEYFDYSLDLRGINRILGKIIKRSSEMTKIAIPVQDISKNSEQSLYYAG